MGQDVYKSVSELAKFEQEGRDYRIRKRVVLGSSTIIIAPHGGRIEKRTSKIARAIAGDNFNLYLFEGIKDSGNKALHVTSHRFDERRCLSMVRKNKRVIAVHGCRGSEHIVYLGGLDQSIKNELSSSLKAAGFRVKTDKFPATHPRNICNRGTTGKGVQIELSLGLRLTGNIKTLISIVGQVLREN